MKWLKLITRCLLGVSLLGQIMVGANLAMAADSAPPPAVAAPATPEPDKTTEIIRTLQDPQAREQLIQELSVLSQTQPAVVAPAAPAKTPTVMTLENLSKSMSGLHMGAQELFAELHQGTVAFSELIKKFSDLHERRILGAILLKCIIVFVLGYLTFFLGSLFILKMRKRFSGKLLHLILRCFLTLFPIALFAIVTYFTLLLIHPDEKTQWVLLAWITAFLIVKILATLFDLFFSLMDAFPGLLRLRRDTVNFLKSWLLTLSALIVYGYFILQSILYLGVAPETYDVLYKMWGFLIVLAFIIFVLRGPRLQVMYRTGAVIYLLLLYLVWITQADHFFWQVLRGTGLSLVLIFLAIKIGLIVHRYLSREFHISQSFKKRLPGLEGRMKRYRKVVDILIRTFLYVSTALLILKIWGGPGITWIPYSMREVIVIKIISIVCIVLVVTFIWELSNSLIEISLTKSGEDLTLCSGRTHTLLTVARKTILITLSLITFLMILAEIGVNIGPLLAGAGVLGLAISFGAQKLVQDLITGFFMLLENQIAVGDVVRIGDNSGTVEAISIRTVRLRDSGGVVHIIPYSSIVTISNLTKDFSYYLFEIGVAYRENIDEVITVLRQLGEDLQKDPGYKPLILEPLDVLGLDKFADSAVIIKARFKTRPGMQWLVGREFNRRMKQKFDELDIQIPFPHSVIFFGENKDHTAPPAHLQAVLEKRA